MPRDNFSQQTINSLAKRVGYLCSNPFCEKHTSGPHVQPDKVASIGVAAHITAASPQGPRYDSNLTTAQRSSIKNGIWLCASCSTLIDKDPDQYPETLLRHWKKQAEDKMLAALQGKNQARINKSPFLEADLIWNGGLRSPGGYSNKNPSEIDEYGRSVTIIGGNGLKPIIYWELTWKFILEIHNNSNYPAINVKIESVGQTHFTILGKLSNINNIQPFTSIAITAEYRQFIEDTHVEADRILSFTIPEQLEGLTLKISYLDEDRKPHGTTVKVENNTLLNIKS